MKHISLFSILLALFACKRPNPQMGPAPSSEDAMFTYSPSDTNENVILFSSNNPNILCMWDFGNGIKKQGNTVTTSYPYAGEYQVKLTVFNDGGSNNTIQTIAISQDDLSLLNNPIYNKLTGGSSGPGYKVWKVDSSAAQHLGVGPDPESALGPVPEWWAANPNEKPGCGLYDDQYKFYLNGFKLDMITNGDVYIHNSLAATFPGSFQNLFDYTAPYDNQIQESWLLTEEEFPVITISNNAFIGFYTGIKEYRILELTDTTMTLQYGHHEGGLLWYQKLKAE
ncbi:MAG: PKD domain-containing protein [Bacteroidetes bacterium]|nr:PKD domain-containing protein [Bacteroidota bacterium]